MKYVRACSATEALGFIGEGYVPLAGGTILTPEITLRANGPESLVDIAHIDQMKAIECSDDTAEIGALVTMGRIVEAPGIDERLACLSSAARTVGNPQVRRAATLGGNLSAALAMAPADQEPAGVFDLATALLVCPTELVLEGADGLDQLPFDQTIAEGLPANSLITKARISIPAGFRSAYRKFAWRKSSGKTIVNVAVSLLLVEGRMQRVRLAAGGIDAKQRRLNQAEGLLEEAEYSDALAAQAAELGAKELDYAFGSWPGEAYRRRLVRVGVSELLKEVSRP